MKTEIIRKNNVEIAVVNSDEVLITDDFFVLSTCLAGEILQKFINYKVRFAIYGDFSKYTSKPLKDFMYESNKGKDVYFQPTVSLAVDKLAGNVAGQY